jgi:hypothetical protein
VAALGEPVFGFLTIATGLVKETVDDLLVARPLLAEPVVDGAVRRLNDLAVLPNGGSLAR